MITRRDFFAGAAMSVAGATLVRAETTADDYFKPDWPYGDTRDSFRLGAAGFTFHKFNLDQTLKMLQQVDLHYLCIKDFHLPLKSTPEQIAEFHAKLAAANVKGYACGPIYTDSEEQTLKAFEYAQRCGVKTLVGIPCEDRIVNGKKQRVSSRKLLEYIDKLVKQFNIRYAIHNHGPDMPLLFPHAENAMEMIGDLDTRIGLCLDIGHELRFDKDPVATFEKYHDRVYDLHLKNVTANNKSGHGTPLPRGKIDLFALVKALRKYNYQGVCALEYEWHMDDPIIEIAECVGYFRGLMDATR